MMRLSDLEEMSTCKMMRLSDFEEIRAGRFLKSCDYGKAMRLCKNYGTIVLGNGVSSIRQDESPSQGLSLNRSQRGNCSTEYNTPPGT
ncbi:hypothetical protein M0804_015340 [Polistes exclamans]|nr:hypothetical protein M0804_015340 [Polistes exclamans]